MRSLNVKFEDFYKGFDIHHNIYVDVLSRKYDVSVIVDDASEPDLLFYSFNGSRHYGYDCIKVYCSLENDVPNFNECDYALSAHYLQFGDRHLRFPQYLIYDEYDALDVPCEVTETLFHREFCSAVVSQVRYSSPVRLQLLDAIDAYKPVAFGGAYRNNVGGRISDKMDFLRRYKFNLAFENSCVCGYTTEKLVEALAACTVPIYWGNPLVGKEFNPEAYINIADYDTVDNALRAIDCIDHDEAAYLSMLRSPKVLPDARIDWHDRLLCFLSDIVEKGRKYTHKYGIMGHIMHMQARKEAFYRSPLLRKYVGLKMKLSGEE